MSLQIIAPVLETDSITLIDLSNPVAMSPPYLFDCQMNSCENNSTCGCAYNSSGVQ